MIILATDKTVEYCKEHPAGKAGAFFMIRNSDASLTI